MTAFEKCPVCEASVKTENLSHHVDRTHPRAKVDLPPAEVGPKPGKSRYASRKSSRSRLLLSTLIVISLAAVSVLAFSLYQSPPNPPPRIQVAPAFRDLGDIPPTLASTTIVVENVGEGELVLLAISTSCTCTSAVFRFGGRVSPTFGMHGNPAGWRETLQPGERGELTVTYDPNLHPDTGPIVRAVYITSNDPANREFQITITANVVRG